MRTEREQKLFGQLLSLFEENGGNKNPIYAALCTALQKIDNAGRLGFDFVDREPPDHGAIRGHFSSYYNEMEVVLYANDYEKKLWFLTDWEKLSSKSVVQIMKVFLHELVHYVAFNNTKNYLKLWNVKQKYLLQTAFARLILNYGEFFLPDILAEKKFVNASRIMLDKKFNKAFDIYYSVIRQTDMAKITTMDSLYTKISSILYTSCDWAWARFFDNVLTEIITVMVTDGIVDKKTYGIYSSIRKSYIDIFPGIEKSPEFLSLFHQEIFTPSEIACIEISCADEIPSLQPLALKTIALV